MSVSGEGRGNWDRLRCGQYWIRGGESAWTNLAIKLLDMGSISHANWAIRSLDYDSVPLFVNHFIGLHLEVWVKFAGLAQVFTEHGVSWLYFLISGSSPVVSSYIALQLVKSIFVMDVLLANRRAGEAW